MADSIVIVADPATIEIAQQNTAVVVAPDSTETVTVSHGELIAVEVESGNASLSVSNPQQIDISILGGEFVSVDVLDPTIEVAVGYAVGIGGVPAMLQPGELAGRATTSVAGVYEPITLGSNLSMTGSVLSATGGSGTVTSVSASGTQGVTASVAAPTTTPTITIGLGAITPSSVAAAGLVSGSNLSGTNTGDQDLTPFVAGPAGAVAGRVAVFSGVTGKVIADGGATVPAGGIGSVSTVSVVSANGVTGTVANPTTTPAITLALGAITPSSVAAVGAVTGSNLSGTNTGDQTITLSGDVSGSGTGPITTVIGANRITTSMIQGGAVTLNRQADVGTATVFYRQSAGTGVPEVQPLATLKTDLGLAGTNSGDVTLTGSGGYLSLAAQVLTKTLIDLASTLHVTGILAVANGGLGNSTGTIDGGTP